MLEFYDPFIVNIESHLPRAVTPRTRQARQKVPLSGDPCRLRAILASTFSSYFVLGAPPSFPLTILYWLGSSLTLTLLVNFQMSGHQSCLIAQAFQRTFRGRRPRASILAAPS